MTTYFNYTRKIRFFSKKMHEPTQLNPFYDQGFRPLQTMSVFRTSDKNHVIENITKKWSVDSWTEHENIFVLVHVNTGFLGYFRLKRFITTDSGTSLSHLLLINNKNDESYVLPVNKIRTSQYPKRNFILMTVPFGHMVVAYKRGLTLKMWF
jgi:hypothetical protein